jgi:hypothetical protein
MSANQKNGELHSMSAAEKRSPSSHGPRRSGSVSRSIIVSKSRRPAVIAGWSTPAHFRISSGSMMA